MKSQDIVLLLKLVTQRQSRAQQQLARTQAQLGPLPHDWQGWEQEDGTVIDDPDQTKAPERALTIRGLESSLHLSKSEISQSLRRSMAVGLAMRSRSDGLPQANVGALLQFIIYGLKYVFPATPARVVRGIPTGFSAPVLRGAVAGAEQWVWSDPLGTASGQTIAPLYRSVPKAVRQDAQLYTMLALIDAIRLGRAREQSEATRILETLLQPPR
ncbi:hypothetical protein ThidrDRAFT_3488 [Thiorhodococcus drewsii AZ1]|uniref:Uncharacterized protein n=1 Tax=Thiorhodococcus drewsii AZ1 TaxID=765913 RepID=G2E5C5_9GAMM|nr:hypothetical protein [Thiorhodococcus drewsii]EGV28837.1 hypothetical protein ThidrDRAFT_3488 [Thiorhodococcus drewsii AZ1]